MSQNTNSKPQPSPVDESSLIQALRSGGFTAPRTDEDARQCLDRLIASPTDIPPALQDTDAAVSRILGQKVSLPNQARNNPETEQTESLRRAARKGGKLTPEIEEAMKKARESEGNG